MAILLYSSGITETYEPKEHTFTDEEILSIFKEYKNIRTARLYEVPNTWCIWGENEEIDESEFNKLGSDIIEENVFCPILFIHDTELDPAWMLTDRIILKGYENFKEDLIIFFDQVAEHVIRESQQMRQQNATNLIFLNAIGPTKDKRVMFEFDPHKQSEEFWHTKNFIEFSRKVVGYLNKFYKNDEDVFSIFADKKSVIMVSDENVEFLVNKIIKVFEDRENYEKCKELNEVLKKWKSSKQRKG